MSTHDWQFKLLATAKLRGADQTAVVLRAIFGWRYVDPHEQVMTALSTTDTGEPAAGRTCIISAGGDVLTHWVSVQGEWDIISLGSLETWRDGLRRLADAAKLSDPDRVAFFEEARKWVRDDYRPAAENNDIV